MKLLKQILATLVIFWCLTYSQVHAQDRFDLLDEKLIQLAKNYPGINDPVQSNTGGLSIQEFVKSIGLTNNLNVSVDPAIEVKINSTFSKATAKEVFLFLCKRYDLDIQFMGPIATFVKYSPPARPQELVKRKLPKLNFDNTLNLISYELQNDSLALVLKEVTKITGQNFVYTPDLSSKIISGYIQNTTLETAIEKLAIGNELRITRGADGFYLVEKKSPNTNGKQDFGQDDKLPANKNLKLMIIDGLITAEANNVPISDIVSAVSKELKIDYFLFSELKGAASLKIQNANYDEFLRLLFNGTDLTFKVRNGSYLFGERNIEGLRVSKLITLKNRAIDKMIDFIPTELKKGIEIKLFEDLNGVIVSGSQPRIDELEVFLREIDLVVPMVNIEVIIADVRKTNALTAGITAGLGSPTTVTSGTLLPEYGVTLNSKSINELISGLSGIGLVNLGYVSSNFYISLKALESNGILKLRSTPQIATLNGHEAKLSIGQTQYYLEVNNSLVNSTVSQQNLLQTQSWKPVNADLSLQIDPQVSGDEQITMGINVKQSSFTERVSNTAPPGTINRDFQSIVRVKNGEMIMLAGLDENETNNSGKGLPLLSRLPILKWIFGERTKSKRESKLTIFIKPTIIYN